MRIRFVFATVDLKKGNIVISIDFIARGMSPGTLGQVAFKTSTTFDIFETKFANVDAGESDKFLWIGRKIPRLDAVPSKFDEFDVFHSGDNVIVLSRDCQTP